MFGRDNFIFSTYTKNELITVKSVIRLSQRFEKISWNGAVLICIRQTYEKHNGKL